MATGTNTFLGKAVPLNGESNIVAETAANDILTLTGASSHSGDFIVCETSAGSEVFVVDVSGNITASGGVQQATLTVTGIGTADFAAQNTGTASFAVSGLTSNDVVVISPREATDGVIVVDKVSAGTLQLRNAASEGANVEFNYLVISKA